MKKIWKRRIKDVGTGGRSRLRGPGVAVGVWGAGIIATVLAAVLASVITGWLQATPEARPRGPQGSSVGPAEDERSPLTVAVEVEDDHCNAVWFVPKPPGQIDFSKDVKRKWDPNDPTTTSWNNYFVADGGNSASPTEVYATVQGRGEAEVVLTGITVRVQARRTVPSGTLLDDPCGDVGAFRWLAVDLDHEPPQVTASFDADKLEDLERENIPPERRQPIRFPYQVSLTKAETFLITAKTVDCDCDWVAVLSWHSAGRTGTVVIDDHGKPFRTTSTRGAIAKCATMMTCAPP